MQPIDEMATYTPAPTEAPETSMIHSDTDTDTVNISLNIRLNFSYSTNISDLRGAYAILVAVSVCLFVAVAVYQTVMKALIIVLVVVVMVALSYVMYVYMNNKVNLTTQFNIIKYLTKEQRQDQSSEIRAAGSVVNMGNIDSEISRTNETQHAHRRPAETVTNKHDDTEIIGSTAGLQPDVVNSAPVTMATEEDDLPPIEDEDDPVPGGAYGQMTPLCRSQPFHEQQRQRQSPQSNDIQVAQRLLIQLLVQQEEFQQAAFRSQLLQQLPGRLMQPNDFMSTSPIFRFAGFPSENCAVVRARHTTGSESMVVRRRTTAVDGPYFVDQDVMKPYFNIIAEKMPADWKQLATNLHVTFEQIRAVKAEHSGECWMCCHQVLHMWRSNNGVQATVEDLIQAVRETGHQDVAENLEALQLD
ncbi:uncharacterized protein [Branchiostoma lanceolatum]|uniref:uncharacterized protein n=1 Tax=Branchiostoma lanceolatum TaxID=7740 RepID=UPI0034570FBB